MSKTVVGLFKSTEEAQKVKQALVEDGYAASDIKIMANDHNDEEFVPSTATDLGMSRTLREDSRAEDSTGTGVGQKISNFFHSLTGGDDYAHDHYSTGVNEGGALLTVTTDDDEAADVAAALKQHGAREIEGGKDGGYRNTQQDRTSGYDDDRRGEDLKGQTAIPIVEEELVVGKREVDRGGVRVYSHVVERPADADVTLRDEKVNVERRAVNRPATAADFEGGRSFEVRASGEEAVVGKTSRVVEEVLVGKSSSEHTEAIHDSVRKTEVEVEQIPAEAKEAVTEKNRY